MSENERLIEEIRAELWRYHYTFVKKHGLDYCRTDEGKAELIDYVSEYVSEALAIVVDDIDEELDQLEEYAKEELEEDEDDYPVIDLTGKSNIDIEEFQNKLSRQ